MAEMFTLPEDSEISIKLRTYGFQTVLTSGVGGPIRESRGRCYIVATIKGGNCSQFHLVSHVDVVFAFHVENVQYDESYRL
jgi:hypothetical protein